MILGHCHPKVVEAIRRAAGDGASFGAPTPTEIELAEMVCDAYPNIEKVRMVSSGTEATMSAIRLARGYTGRDKILKFDGCYHGHADSLLVKAGSGAATFGVPTSPGVPADFAKHTLTATYNDLDEVRAAGRGQPGADRLHHPRTGRRQHGLRRPRGRASWRDCASSARPKGIVLIVDEVMTGFRVAYGGAQERFGVRGDLVCLGKIIGGGLPVGAFGGKQEIMDQLSPEGGIYQAGTLSGNPAGHERRYRHAEALEGRRLLRSDRGEERLPGKRLDRGGQGSADPDLFPAGRRHVLHLFSPPDRSPPSPTPPKATPSASASSSAPCSRPGINLAPSQFEAGFMSAAHSTEELDRTVEAARRAFKGL